MANILVLGAKVPFVRGGADTLLWDLVREIKNRGHTVDTVELPFQCPPKELLLAQAAQWRALHLLEFAGKPVDLIIATKFPSYFARHPKKSVWLVHQHRPIYELHGGPYSDFSDDPRDEALRQALHQGDTKALGEAQYLAGISKNVVDRLKTFNHLDGVTLYPPLPLAGQYRCEAAENYILSVGRICGIKRVDLLIKALPRIHQFMKVKIVGSPDEPGIMEYLRNEIDKHHLWDRVEFLGRVDNSQLIDLYAKAFAVYYAPHNEDYGYVTLEAMASAKPVITATDSGGTLEFIRHNQNGVVVAPTIDGLVDGVNQLVSDPTRAAELGIAGRETLGALGLLGAGGWDQVVAGLLSPLSKSELSREEAVKLACG